MGEYMPGEPLLRRPSRVVLVVEDDVLLRLVIASSLRYSGFEVFEAVDAVEAVTILNTMAVDALFADINLPSQMNGVALAHWVREHQAKTRVLLTSGGKQPPGEADECDYFLAKPYDDAEVNRLLTRMLSH